MDAHLTRRADVDGRQLVVLDGLFGDNAIRSLFEFLEQLPYSLNDIDSHETAYARHWKAELAVDFATEMPVLRDCVAAARTQFAPADLRLERVHANLHMYGDAQYPHQDLANGVTALYYANPDWNEKWFGETVFYNAGRDPVQLVAPRPGRVVLFDADIVHRAGVPSRDCYAPRITLAFKFVRARE